MGDYEKNEGTDNIWDKESMKQYEDELLEYHTNKDTLAYKTTTIKKTKGNANLHKLSLIKVFETTEYQNGIAPLVHEITISLIGGLKIECFTGIKTLTIRDGAGKDDNERISTFKTIKLTQEDEANFLDVLSNLDFSSWIEREQPDDYWPSKYQTMQFQFVDENGIWMEKIWEGHYPMLNIVEEIRKIINSDVFNSFKSRRWGYC